MLSLLSQLQMKSIFIFFMNTQALRWFELTTITPTETKNNYIIGKVNMSLYT